MTVPGPEPRRICLMRLSALGDVCLVLPLVRTLQAAFPQAQITWVISRAMHEFLAGLDGVEFVIYDKGRAMGAYLNFWRTMGSRQFDVLLAAQASWRANLLYPLIHAPVKIGFDRARARDFHRYMVNRHIAPGRQHLLDGFLSFATALGVEKKVIEWRLPLTPADTDFARAQLGPEKIFWLAVNPAASKARRNWPPERYAAVINHALEKRGWRVVLTGGPGPGERTLGEAVLAGVHRKSAVLNLIGKTTAKQLAAVLGRVNALLAPDTGPVHVATAMGTPVVGLYAEVTPELSGPYFSPNLVVNKFPEAVRQFLGRDPDKVPLGTRVRSAEAMKLVTVEAVLQELGSLPESRPINVARSGVP